MTNVVLFLMMFSIARVIFSSVSLSTAETESSRMRISGLVKNALAMATRCLENHVFAITANRIGTEERGKDKFYFTGASQITSHKGEILSSAPKDECYVDFVEIDIEKARNKKLNKYNDMLSDRRSDLYVS